MNSDKTESNGETENKTKSMRMEIQCQPTATCMNLLLLYEQTTLLFSKRAFSRSADDTSLQQTPLLPQIPILYLWGLMGHFVIALN